MKPASLVLLLALALAVSCAPKKPVVTPEPVKKIQSFPGYVAVTAEPGDTLASLAQKHLGDAGKAWILKRFNGIEEPVPGQTVVVPTKPLYLGGLFTTGYQTVPVLSYHKLHPSKSDKMTVTVADFEAQMAYLRDNDFTVVTLDQFYDFLEFKAPLPFNSVVITFDDGRSSFYDLAWPILERYGYPATLFIYCQMITGSKTTLSWEQVLELAQKGVDIQCHTMSHRDMAVSSPDEDLERYYKALEKEILLCAKIIEEKTGIQTSYLAYPYGKCNDLVIALLEKNGFRGGLTVQRGSNAFYENNYLVQRRMIYGEYGLEQFAQQLDSFKREALQ